MTKEELLSIVKFDKDGLIPVIAQDYHSKHVRMLAYMNKEALEKTLETGNVYYYSDEDGLEHEVGKLEDQSDTKGGNQ